MLHCVITHRAFSLYVLFCKAGLFHESIGDHPYKRRVIISPFKTGFDNFLKSGQLKPHTSIPIRECKPWFYRTHGQASGFHVMQMYLLENGDNVEEIITESTNLAFGVNQMVCWHFSRKKTIIAAGIDLGMTSNGWNNDEGDEVGRLGNDELTPKSNNSFFYRVEETLSEKIEIITNGDTNDLPLNDVAIDHNYLVHTITKIAKKRIYELIDQPSMCIRDEYDEFDFQKSISDDLFTLVPLGVEESSCLLVNTKETMLQCIREIEVRWS